MSSEDKKIQATPLEKMMLHQKQKHSRCSPVQGRQGEKSAGLSSSYNRGEGQKPCLKLIRITGT